ncbi:MAG: hypothetical protein PVI74_04085, partial [Syntrophobacterales bacterium]
GKPGFGLPPEGLQQSFLIAIEDAGVRCSSVTRCQVSGVRKTKKLKPAEAKRKFRLKRSGSGEH